MRATQKGHDVVGDNIREQAPLIAATQMQAAGFEFHVVADVDPARFPNGVDIIVLEPGKVAPIGQARVVAGCMLAILPPTVAHHIRPQYQAHEAAMRRTAGVVGVNRNTAPTK